METAKPVKRERIFWLDFIRALAIFLIIMQHFQWNYFMATPSVSIFPMRIGGVLIGDIGSSLFLMISGSVLMYCYGGKVNLPVFYKKRFLNIYPMFWIAWILCYLAQSLMTGQFTVMAPYPRLILTFLGIDQFVYAASGASYVTWAIVGEWFLGLIIIFYILFPILRKGVMEHPFWTSAITLAVFALSFFILPGKLDYSLTPMFRLPEFVFGMMFMYWIKKVKFYVPLAAAAVLTAMAFITFPIPKPIMVSAAGCACFIILAWLGNLITVSWVQKIFSVVAKYSYAIFLVHHFIINNVERLIGAVPVRRLYMLLLLVICLLLIAAASLAVFWLEHFIVKTLKPKKRPLPLKGE